ncbi:MAG: Abi family protein [Clostridium sp.]|nr:Abi family protein [Clostridium sp.]
MNKSATTIDKQLQILKTRGLTIRDQDKAKEILLDIGYYRLGFYLFPFEKSYPQLSLRTHQYAEGSTFEDAVRLYYFDFDLRLLLMRYLNRIEIAFRTSMIYTLSNKYSDDNLWFVNPSVVNRTYADNFQNKVYNSDFKLNPVIARHHHKYPSDEYAPAWKTLEFMTFGAVLKLYEQLKDASDKIKIANLFGLRQVVTFESYMHTIRNVRNACAHGSLLYDLKLPMRIRRGPASSLSTDSGNIIGALRVVKYIMKQVSANRANEMDSKITALYSELCLNSPALKPLIPDFTLI